MITYAPLGVAIGIGYLLWQILGDARIAALPTTDRVVITMTIAIVAMIGFSSTVIVGAMRSRP